LLFTGLKQKECEKCNFRWRKKHQSDLISQVHDEYEREMFVTESTYGGLVKRKRSKAISPMSKKEKKKKQYSVCLGK